MNKKIFFGLFLLGICSLFLISPIQKKYQKWHRQRQRTHYLNAIRDSQKSSPSEWPFQLQGIPFSDDQGIITDVKTISIEGIKHPYNASLLKKDNGYDLFFRFDTRHDRNIGHINLDKDFSCLSEKYTKINTGSSSSEDPRAIKIKDDIFLVFNIFNEKTGLRAMRLGKIGDFPNLASLISLEIQQERHEKNWSPFIYEDLLFFEYYINPHKILELPKLEREDTLRCAYQTEIKNLNWEKVWGELRGGSPPLKIGEEYLGFFHSAFKNKDHFFWYVMGAYTFEGKPPFRITSLSPYPILYRDIYMSPLRKQVRCIFPCGYVTENKEGKDYIHLSCGENDTTIKIITLDQDKLIKSLQRFN